MNPAGPYLSLLLVFTLLGYGCSKDHSYAGRATIVGLDARMGPCEGGWFIQIDGDPNVYDIGAIPSSFRLDTMNHYQDFPVRVLLDYKIRPVTCGTSVVDISRITRMWIP